MHKFKLFLAIMFAVAIMQMHGSHAVPIMMRPHRSEDQDKLHDALHLVQEEIIKPERRLLNFDMALRNYANQLFFCVQNQTISLSDHDICTEDAFKKIDKLEVGLSHKILNTSELVAIAKEIRNINTPRLYRKEYQYCQLEDVCSDIIQKNLDKK